MTPTITVAIPTYNGERHIAEALRGILTQEDAAFDLLVCDDSSDDRTLERVRAEAGDRARIVTGSERLGLAANWNRCMAESRTPWVAIFHQDDVMRPGHLRDHLDAIERERPYALGLIAGPADVVDESGKPVAADVVDPGGVPDSTGAGPGRIGLYQPGGFVRSLASGNILRCSAVTTNKRAHEIVSGFDSSLRYVVDWDFWIRVAERFGVAWCNGPPTVSVRWHPDSETHRFKATLEDLEESERIAAKFPILDHRTCRRKLGRAYLNRAHDALHAGRIELAREALGRSVRLAPSLVATILADPRLAAQMSVLALAPGVARRWFSSVRND
ncbi:MAG: glycosyltransferase [Paludisphaera borealis]|uniref:glycosyltransferase family 2 protein n=1 Tax=Paludisphaera borealis TaxID=1387353 RepID=UPI002840D9CF|nr:glycosyltransferase [Paludisphaera borealis]MDR3621125.1 glycosyltransferase [Paludisphaera borealis]